MQAKRQYDGRDAPFGGSSASLVAYIDFTSANSRLALGPTLALADEAGAAVDWRPFHLKPRRRRAASSDASAKAKPTEAAAAIKPAKGLPASTGPAAVNPPAAAPADAARSALHIRVRAEYRRREQALYARSQGIELRHPPQELDGFAANAGLLWMRRQGAANDHCRAFVTQVFADVWSGRMDPADADAVALAISEAGGDCVEFGDYLAGPAQAELDALCDEARALGANDTPAFWVGGELYIGRQHLPVIRWWLTGQTGPPPV